MRKKIANLMAALLAASLLLLGCGGIFVTNEYKASHDCDFSEVAAVKEAACDYVDAIKGEKVIANLIKDKEDEIKVLEDEKTVLESKFEASHELTKKFEELWKASGKPSTKVPPPTATAKPRKGGSN